MNEIKKAIEIFEADCRRCEVNGLKGDCEKCAKYIALTALREKSERENGCEYCNSEAYEHCGAKTIFGLPKVYLGEPDENSRFKFCQKCGKRLEVRHE